MENNTVKIATDMFGNRKIKSLLKMQEGQDFVVIWVMLLTAAGRCNCGGMIFFTENVPYTPEVFANEFDIKESTVCAALKAFDELNMVKNVDGFWYVIGWEKHQGLKKKKRKRKEKSTKKEKNKENKKNTTTFLTTDSLTQRAREENAKMIGENGKNSVEIGDLVENSVENSNGVPTLSEISAYFVKEFGFAPQRARHQAMLFEEYNQKLHWSCLPNWKCAVIRWVEIMGEDK